MTTPHDRKELIVGTFVLAGLAAVACLALKIGAGVLVGADTYLLEARFTNIGGLNPGSNVLIAGVSVGRVEAVRLDPKDYSAIAELRLRSSVKLPVDSSAAIRTSGLIGDKYLSLSPGGETRMLGPGGTHYRHSAGGGSRVAHQPFRLRFGPEQPTQRKQMISSSQRILVAALLTVFTAVSGTVNAVETVTNPSETLRIAVTEGMAVIYEKSTDGRTIAQRTLPVMERYFDFAMMTRRAAGPHWTKFSAEQQQRTLTLLTELAVRSYCSHFDPIVRSEVTYLKPMPMSPERCEFPTLVTYYGQNYTVGYRAELVSGSWHFYDVVVEGVSLVGNYRAQFDSLFMKSGPDAIIHALEQTLANSSPVK